MTVCETAVPDSRPQRWALAAIDWYQGIAADRPSPCRFFPSCSTYAHDAYTLHGARRGSWLTMRRLVRCRPFGSSGYDPVPDPDSDQSVAVHCDGHTEPATQTVAQPVAPTVAHKDC